MALRILRRLVSAAANLSRALRYRHSRRVTGRFVSRTYANGAGARTCKIYLPACYRARSLPLVVMLHGCKQTPEDFAAGTRMNELAEELGFIVLYPAQARSANPSGCWNWFAAANQQRDHGEPSIIAGMTRHAIARYRADARRVYVAGLSAGAAMAAVMGATCPDLYAAVAIHSGLPYASASDLPSGLAAMRGGGTRLAALPAVPTIVFHGDCDRTVHPRNGEIDHHDAVLRRQTGEAGGRRYTRTVYGGKPRLEHWLVHGMGHAWCGGSPRGTYTDPTGPDASREILRFFALA